MSVGASEKGRTMKLKNSGFQKTVIRKCSVCIVAAVLFLLVLQGCGADKEEGVDYVIGVSQPNLSESWRIAMNDEIRKEASGYEDVKVVFYDAGQDVNKQKKDLQSLMSQRIDALILSLNDTESLSSEIAEIKKAGVPVIVVGYPPEGVTCDVLVFCDNFKLGKLAGEYAVEALGEKGGSILEVLGDTDSVITKERKNGFRVGIGSNPRIRIEYVVVGYWLRDKTEERVTEILGKVPRTDFVFAHNDAMAMGASKIARQMGLDLKCIGIGGVMPDANGVNAVKNHILDATFIFPTGGKEALQFALNKLRGLAVPEKYELSPLRVTKKNADN